MTYTSNPTAENELTQMLSDDRYERTLKNISRRAETLWADGYRFAFFGTDFYEVFTPKGEIYSVLLNEDNMPGCDCPAWSTYGTCKHYQAIELMARDAAQAEAFDSMMANAEGPMGTDPDCRF